MDVPGSLAVVVGVNINKAGSNDFTAGIQRLIRCGFNGRAYLSDLSRGYRDITNTGLTAGSVVYLTVSDDQIIVFQRFSSCGLSALEHELCRRKAFLGLFQQAELAYIDIEDFNIVYDFDTHFLQRTHKIRNFAYPLPR